ncbi:protein FAR1-RELATED SEQUENCE 5-like [Silene latifolia]|uniref:protein FAR1-RELATED SEQUENCE 5-like n=1 Tax=Silene latifolia TaxID=37657 RepID=UPI003D76DAE4
MDADSTDINMQTGERWMHVVEHKFRPTIGAVFASLEAGIKFYEVYARACGFTLRKHSTKTLRGGVAHQKFVVCNRQGFMESKPKQRPRTKDDENMGDGSSTRLVVTRRVKITRIGCRAYVGFALLHGLDGPAMIDEFSEVHNHRLTTLILDNSKLNIGAGLTFRQVKELVNGHENIGATLIDFKNFQRDIKCYIRLRDVDLFIDRLEKLKATQPQFYFAYDVDSQNRLTKFFWADATCIRNYSFFGDAVSFDPTYGTNKYDMAFPSVFKTARRRYFMWHITQKITDKVGSALCRDTDFLARFNAVVWDPDMEPSEFEEKWQKVISDFELEDNDWLTTMFQTAMDQQRYTRRCNDYNSDHSFPELKTELPIEKHGAIIYTHAVFKVF